MNLADNLDLEAYPHYQHDATMEPAADDFADANREPADLHPMDGMHSTTLKEEGTQPENDLINKHFHQLSEALKRGSPSISRSKKASPSVNDSESFSDSG